MEYCCYVQALQVACIGLLLMLSWRTYLRNWDWQDEESLYRCMCDVFACVRVSDFDVCECDCEFGVYIRICVHVHMHIVYVCPYT